MSYFEKGLLLLFMLTLLVHSYTLNVELDKVKKQIEVCNEKK